MVMHAANCPAAGARRESVLQAGGHRFDPGSSIRMFTSKPMVERISRNTPLAVASADIRSRPLIPMGACRHESCEMNGIERADAFGQDSASLEFRG
jgi:hypothetical protein